MRHTHILSTLFIAVGSLFLSACDKPAPQATTAPAEQSQSADHSNFKKTRKVEGRFEDISDDIKIAITDRGIKINNISHIGNMLARTGKDVGSTVQVFAGDAVAIEFCSSTISRETMEADPHNIVFCPYIISVYSLPGDEEHTYVTYRKPLLVGDARSKASLKAVENLLEEIIVEALGE